LKNDKKTMKLAPRNGKSSKAVFVFLLLIYFISSFMLIMASRSNDNVVIFGQSIRFTAFTGVFSATANICIIFIVVFFWKNRFYHGLIFPDNPVSNTDY
jgi:pheromone shutdown protein TraB